MVQLEQASSAVRLTNAGVVTYTDKDDKQQVTESIRHLWALLGSPSQKGNLLSLFKRDGSEVVLALPRALVSTKRLANLPTATDDQLENIVAIGRGVGTPLSD